MAGVSVAGRRVWMARLSHSAMVIVVVILVEAGGQLLCLIAQCEFFDEHIQVAIHHGRQVVR